MYQKEPGNRSSGSQQEMLKKLELSQQDHLKLYRYCQKMKIGFLSSAFDLESIDMLAALNLDYWKIPSGEITNLPYLKKIAGYGDKVLLSTGMSTLEEVSTALSIFLANGTRKKDITVLHCHSEYPTSLSDVNLRAMQTIQKKMDVKVGYSDHTLGITVTVAAVIMGATVIEKHFTLDNSLPGPDHKASLEPDELVNMVKAIREAEVIPGSGEKTPTESEKKNISSVRKSIHLRNSVPAGHTLSEKDLIMKRPGDGISPMVYEQLIGKMIRTGLPPDHKLSWDDINN